MGAGTRGWAWLLGGALLLSGCAGRTDSTQGSGGKTVEEMLAARRGEQICCGGVWYERKEDARAYLLMGIDREGQAVSSGSYNGGGQADLLLVLVLDREERTYRVLPIDRDTMTPVDELGLFGDTVRTRVQQIALAHFYGDGLEASCENTVAAVSNLLGGVPLDGYAALQMDAIPLLNDWAGGVTVTLRDDFSQTDLGLEPGTTVTLTGEQAYSFLRSRVAVGDGTNAARMARHREYLSALAGQMDLRLEEDLGAMGELYAALEPYMVTDLGSGTVSKIALDCRNYADGGVVTIDGTWQMGETYLEFYPDGDSLEQAVLTLFYTEAEGDGE